MGMDSLTQSMDNFPIRKAEGFTGQRLIRLPNAVLKRIRKHPFTHDFIITDLGFYPPSSGHYVERQDDVPQWILIFVHSGKGQCSFQNKRHELSAGNIALIAPYTAHTYAAHPHNPWSIFWFHFEGQGAHELLSWITPGHESHVLKANTPDTLRRHFNTIISTVERGYHEHTFLELSRSLINVLTSLHRNPAHGHRNPSYQRIESSMQTMQDELSDPRPLKDYADECHLSLSQYTHLFKSYTGISPMTYLTELRIQRACEYLDTTDLTIKQIASELGYNDPFYFSRLFKKSTGVSPKLYRITPNQ
jgi:AraC-like DNA-binding protein